MRIGTYLIELPEKPYVAASDYWRSCVVENILRELKSKFKPNSRISLGRWICNDPHYAKQPPHIVIVAKGAIIS